MPADVWTLYALILRSRLFEEATAKLWHDGLISEEMHLGTGEVAIVASVVSHVREGGAMALDHRGSAALLMRGLDPVLILRELLGCSDGLCGGMGGHMHLFSRDQLAASSGIVGEAGTRTGRVLVVDEDFGGFGLSGEVAAVLSEKGLFVKYERVCTRTTIPHARHLEDAALPNVGRICASARKLVQASPGRPTLA